MAIDVCSEISISSAGISPRISFSHDLNQSGGGGDVAVEDHQKRLDSALLDSDFDFYIGNNSFFVQELSSADELFSNGRILPGNQIKKEVQTKKQVQFHQPQVQEIPFTAPNPQKKRLKELLSIDFDAEEKPAAPKSFWQFKRSSSLNCESTRGKGLIRSLLSRSNSTGSTPNPKPVPLSKETTQKQQHLHRQPSISSTRKSSSSVSGVQYPYSHSSSQKLPPLKKSGSHNNGVRISPVLNLPPPYISNATVSFFGFGSLFCYNKTKKKKR